MLPTTLTLSLPTWVRDLPPPDPRAHLTDRMELVLDLAMRNVERNTGGPFAAAVFEQESGRLVSVGVNRVVPESCSVAHAEVLAIALAQASHRDLRPRRARAAATPAGQQQPDVRDVPRCGRVVRVG